MQSVEILEGPQGTLYGAGALGGIILLKPNMPDPLRTGGEARLDVSLTQHGEAQAPSRVRAWAGRGDDR